MKRAALLLLTLALPRIASAAPPTKDIHQTVRLDAKGSLSIETYKGQVTLNGWDRSEVKIDAQVVADLSCGDQEYQQEQVQKTEVRIEPGSGTLRIVSDYDKLSDWALDRASCSSRPFVNYQISAPATAKLRIDDHKSSIKLSNIHSDLRVHSHKGTIQINDLEGALDLQTHKGEARAAFSKLAGPSRVQTYKGQIELAVPRGAGFQLDADLGKRGRLDSNFEGMARVAKAAQYRAAVNGGGPELKLATSRGSFMLEQL